MGSLVGTTRLLTRRAVKLAASGMTCERSSYRAHGPDGRYSIYAMWYAGGAPPLGDPLLFRLQRVMMSALGRTPPATHEQAEKIEGPSTQASCAHPSHPPHDPLFPLLSRLTNNERHFTPR
jgi:hypothetical protein